MAECSRRGNRVRHICCKSLIFKEWFHTFSEANQRSPPTNLDCIRLALGAPGRPHLGRRMVLRVTRHDSFSLVSLVSGGFGVGFALEWTAELPDHDIVLKKVRGIDFRIGLGGCMEQGRPDGCSRRHHRHCAVAGAACQVRAIRMRTPDRAMCWLNRIS